MVERISYTWRFEKKVKKLKDKALKERVKKEIEKIVERPETGKPLRFSRRGERTVWTPPFRIIYTFEGDTLKLLDFDHRKKVYR
jgi:mRNA-degrading endonuclease RelE of RelBE toxin-antitoxin system